MIDVLEKVPFANKRVVQAVLLCSCLLFIVIPAGAQTPTLPTGELVRGRVEPVPEGALVATINNIVVSGMGGEAHFSGPPGFLITMSGEAAVTGGPLIRGRGAIFLQGGISYSIRTTVDWPAEFLFIGLGRVDEIDDAKPSNVADTLYETRPLPWGPGQGKAYDVSINREKFSGGGATPWHNHTGPAFGILDGGDWENRQATGSTERIQTPGYYLQPAGPVHQLAQVGEGGYTYIVQFFPPGQPKTGGGPGVAAGTPTVVVAVETPIASAAGRNLLFPDSSFIEPTPTTVAPAVSATSHLQPDDNVGESKLQMMALCGAGGFVLVLVFGALAALIRLRRRS